MTTKKPLVALVGTNIGDERFEPGDTIPNRVLSEAQRTYLLVEGHAEEEGTEHDTPGPDEPKE